MDIKHLLENLREEGECSVCQELYKDPKQLPCLHSFCLNCLNRLAQTRAQNRNIECPVCRRETAVPECGTFETLPSSFYLNSLLDVLAIKQCDTSKVSCGNCDKKSEGSSYCFDCGKFWCQQCLVGHNILRDNREHHVVVLKDFQAKDYENVLKRPAFCTKEHHENKVMKYYCTTCTEAACPFCVAIEHSGHKMKHLEVLSKEERSKIVKEIEKVKKTAQEYEKGIRKIDKRSQDIRQQVEAVKRDVCEFVQNVIISLHQRKQELITKAENEGRRSLERLEHQKNQIHTELRKIEVAVQQTQNVVQRSTSAEIVQCANNVKQKTQELLDKELCLFPSENVRLKFSTDGELLNTLRIWNLQISRTCPDQTTAEGKGLTEAICGLKAKFDVTSRNGQGEQIYYPEDRVTIELKSREGEDRVTEVQIEDNENGTYSVSYFVKESGLYDTFVMMNGKPVGGMPFEPVQVRPRTFKPVLSIGREGTNPGEFQRPFGVAVNERDEIATTDHDNDRIQVFCSEGKFIRCFGKKGSNNGEFNYLRGVAWYGKGNIVVADHGNNRIQQFSGTGEFISTFGRKGNLDGELSAPNGLSIGNHGNIIVAETGNHRIQVFSPDGQFLFKLGKEGELSCPFSCIFYNNQYIVSDYYDNCIKAFNEELQFLYKFGTEGEGDGELNHPAGLAVDKSGHLLVCDSTNCRVQLFRLDGTFLAKFGESGRNPGQFVVPFFLAVLSDGRFVVSDCGNNCLQILE